MSPESAKPRVLVIARTFASDPSLSGRLVDAGCELLPLPYGYDPTEAQLAEMIAGADGVIAGVQRFTARVVGAAPRLRVIARSGVGVDAIDLGAATARGVVVTNTPEANAVAVADHAFGLLIAVARRIPAAHQSVVAGRWDRFVGVDVWGKTLGIAGLGRIGRGMALRGRGFGMKLLAYEAYPDRDFVAAHGVELVSLEDLLCRSDFVTLHLPLTEETRGVIEAERLSWMKPTAYLINAARGELIDEQALADALRQRALAGAALDVFASEPPAGSPLLDLDNVVLSPHNAAFTIEAMRRMATDAIENLLAVLAGRRAPSPVNPAVYDRLSAR